jgi:tRNA splicing endonuclease
VEDVLVEQVFKDLQSRGFKILERLGDRMFVAEKKDKYLFYVMVEGVEVTVHTLLSVINMGETHFNACSVGAGEQRRHGDVLLREEDQVTA